jgi:hypothetical protein
MDPRQLRLEEVIAALQIPMGGLGQASLPLPPQRTKPYSSPRDWGGDLAKEYWKWGYKKL